MKSRILTFYIKGELFGIDIVLVKEINRNIGYTPIPGAKDNILGLLNMRGHVTTIFNISKILGFGEDLNNLKKSKCIILKPFNLLDDTQIGFLIDKSGDVLDINKDERERVPANISSIQDEYIESIVKMKDEILIIINPYKMFDG